MQWDANPSIILDVKTLVGVGLPIQVIPRLLVFSVLILLVNKHDNNLVRQFLILQMHLFYIRFIIGNECLQSLPAKLSTQLRNICQTNFPEDGCDLGHR